MRSALLLCAVLSGCFYADPINQRPSIDIRQTEGEEVFRNQLVTLKAVANDPENDVVFYSWRAYACTDATEQAGGERPGCDAVPFYTEILDEAKIVVPSLRTDEAVPVEVVLVILEAQDDHGAIARPRDELLIPISNRAPGLELAMRPRHGYVVNTAIDLYAEVSDEDDGAAAVRPLEWKLFTPMDQPSFEPLVDIDVADPDAPKYLQFGKRFTPKGVGEWEVQVTATDPLGAATMKSLIINVVPDAAPCLSQWAPIAAPTGSAWPLTEATLFQVSVVADDLDPYPTVPGDPDLGTTTFAWSILQPGASSRQALAVTSNQVPIDPANYVPGDIVELRVEIQDRNQTAITCADGNATCSVISDPQCIQRLTWRMEVH